jgi:hypothetical protein
LCGYGRSEEHATPAALRYGFAVMAAGGFDEVKGGAYVVS